MKNEKKKGANPLYTSILLLLMALAAVTAVTIAWLSIADSTRVRSMNLDITSGANLRFDLDAHNTFEDYVKSLTFQQIASRIESSQGFSMETTPLEPVTTADYSTFTFEDGSEVSAQTGAYLTFELNFMATQDMVVHLTSAAGKNGEGGTAVSSQNTALPSAMRISFTADGTTTVYNPGMAAESTAANGAMMFGLPGENAMLFNNSNALFSLEEEQNKVVLVHVWLEGTDEACTDELKNADYSISLRFEGTDEGEQTFDSAADPAN